MLFPFRAVVLLLLVLAVSPLAGSVSFAQKRGSQERIIHDIETRGFRNVTGLQRRGVNYVFQAEDLFGEKVRVVMNVQTGEIVGLSKIPVKQN